jgi:hypothetical protein
VEDALELRIRQADQPTSVREEDVAVAFREARRSSLANLCSRLLRYAICIGETQQDNNIDLEDFIRKLEDSKRQDYIALSSSLEEESINNEDDFVVHLGIFENPLQSCSLLAEV